MLLCKSGNQFTHLSRTFDQLVCDDYDCSRCRMIPVVKISDLVERINQKETFKQRGYQKIIEFYGTVIRCLEFEKGLMLKRIDQQYDEYFGELVNKIKEFLNTNQMPLNIDQNVWQAHMKILSSKKNQSQFKMNQILLKHQKNIFQVIQNIRNIWTPNNEGFEQISKFFKEYEPAHLLQSLNNPIFSNTKQQTPEIKLESLQKIKISTNVRPRQLQTHILSLSVFSPNIQHITISKQSTKQSMKFIFDNLYRFKQLFSLKIEETKVILIENKIDNIKKLEICTDNLKVINDNIKNFPSIKELILCFQPGIRDQKQTTLNFNDFGNIEKLKISSKHWLSHLKVENIKSLKNLECLELLISHELKTDIEVIQLPKLKSLAMTFSREFFKLKESFESNIQQLQLIKPFNFFQIPKFIQNFKSLKKLWFDGITLQKDEKITNSFLQYLPNLKLLSMQKQKYNQSEPLTTVNQLEVMCRFNIQLLFLRLDGQPVRNKGAMLIGNYLKNLVFLSVDECQIQDIGMSYLQKLQNLKSITISNTIVNKLIINLFKLKNVHSIYSRYKKDFHQRRKFRNQKILLKNVNTNCYFNYSSNHHDTFKNLSIMDFKKFVLRNIIEERENKIIEKFYNRQIKKSNSISDQEFFDFY